MRFRPLTWLLLSLFFFLAGGLVWQLSDKYSASHPGRSVPAPAPAKPAPLVPGTVAPTGTVSAPSAKSFVNTNYPFRLANTAQTIRQLATSGSAILLENALIDTASTVKLEVPAHLRAGPDDGTYIVQARGALDDAFRTRLAQAGAEIVA